MLLLLPTMMTMMTAKMSWPPALHVAVVVVVVVVVDAAAAPPALFAPPGSV